MKLSTKCRYGMRALVDIAGSREKIPVKRKDIAEREGVSEGYLENLLVSLKISGLLYTVRGAKGGYVLTRPPEQITLLEVYEALEGPVAPVECLIAPSFCSRLDGCVTRRVWDRIRVSIETVLSQTTLRDLVREQKKGR
jgi:Rrf2 family protein